MRAHLHADGVLDLDLAPLLALALLLLQLLVPGARLQRAYEAAPIQLPASQTPPVFCPSCLRLQFTRSTSMQEGRSPSDIYI